MACQELTSLGPTLLDDTLKMLKIEIDAYLKPMPPEKTDPLYLEKSMPSTDSVILNYRDGGNTVAGWFTVAIQELDSLLGVEVSDAGGPTGTDVDLAVNVLLRQYLLEEDRSLTIQVADLPFPGFDSTLFKSHDKLTETTITLDTIKVFGLDTFTHFSALQAIGNQTLQNEFKWDYLTFELDVTLDIKASSLPDAIITDPDPTDLVEKIRIKFGVDDLDILFSLFLAIDETKLLDLELGSLLHSDHLLVCFLSMLHDVDVAGLYASVKDIHEPTLEGFVTPGLDRVLTQMSNVAFLVFEPTFKRALPSIFQGPLRDILSEQLVGRLFTSPGRSICPPAEVVDTFIDFRDLLLNPSRAKELGASGNEQYGNIGHILFTAVQDQFYALDSDGLPKVNDLIMRPVTKAQSSKEGALRFPEDLVAIVQDDMPGAVANSLGDRFEFKLYDLRFRDLDTISEPLALLQPTYGESVLENLAAARQFSVTVRMLVSLQGEDTFMNMLNEIDLTASVRSLELMAGVKALLSSPDFLGFQIRHLGSPDCWLANFPVLEDGNFGIELNAFVASLHTLSLEATCLACTSPGTTSIPDLVRILRQTGAITTFGKRLESFLSSFLVSGAIDEVLGRLIGDAHKFCPTSRGFDEDAVRSVGGMRFPSLPAESIDTMLYAAALAAEVAFVVLAESHRQSAAVLSSPLSAQESFSVRDSDVLVDWTDLSSTFGGGSLFDDAFEELRGYLAGEGDSGALRINNMMEEMILDDSLLHFDLDLATEIDNFTLALDSVTISGLNRFTKFNVFDPLAPQTLLNDVALESIGVELSVFVGYISSSEAPQRLTISFEAKNVTASVALFAALDFNKLKALELGSLLYVRNILPCILSTAAGLDVPQLLLNVGSFEAPRLTGLMPDTAASATAAVEAITAEFGGRLVEALPILFDTTVKGLLSGLLEDWISSSRCPFPYLPNEELLDFRKLFADADGPLDGTTSYGDVLPMLMKFLDSELFAADGETKFAKINRLLISPLTKEQSGIAGTLRAAKEIFGFSFEAWPQAGFSNVIMSGLESVIENLNTFVAPIKFLRPRSDEAHVLDNEVSLGHQASPLRMSTNLLIETTGDSVLSTRNEMNLSLDISNLSLAASIFARIGLDSFLAFPMEKMGRASCLGSLFTAPELDQQGIRRDTEAGLGLKDLSLLLEALKFRAECASSEHCSSKGLLELPTLMVHADTTGISKLLSRGLPLFATEVLRSSLFQTYVDRWLNDLTWRCAGLGSAPSYRLPPLPRLTGESIDTLALAAAYAAQAGWVVVAKSHEGYLDWDTHRAMEDLVDDSTRLIDFTDLGSTIGRAADDLLRQAREYLGGTVDDSSGGRDLGVNILLRSFLLDSDGFLNSSPMLRLGSPEMGISLRKLKIRGLDTFTLFDIINATGPHNLRNRLSLQDLMIEIQVGVGPETEETEFLVAVAIKSLVVDVGMLLGVAWDALGAIEFGQIFDTGRILKCLLSSARRVSLTDLDVSVESIELSKFSGFQDAEIELASRSFTDRIQLEYGDVLASSIRTIFGVTVKTMLNNWITYYLNQEANVSCPKVRFDSALPSFVDFRDLFLTEAKAILLGGAGDSRYGNLFRRLLEIVNNEILSVDPSTGLSSVNEIVVKQLTKAQSGVPGQLLFPGDIFNQGTRINVGGLDARIELRAYDAFIENLDTIGSPLSLLDPVELDPNTLNNTASIGVGKPLRAGLNFLFGLAGDGKYVCSLIGFRHACLSDLCHFSRYRYPQ